MIESLKSKLIKERAVVKPKDKSKASADEPAEDKSVSVPDEPSVADDAENIFVCVPCGKVALN